MHVETVLFHDANDFRRVRDEEVGPSTDPWGTPEVTIVITKVSPLTRTKSPCQVCIDPLERVSRDDVAVLESIQKNRVVDGVKNDAEIER